MLALEDIDHVINNLEPEEIERFSHAAKREVRLAKMHIHTGKLCPLRGE